MNKIKIGDICETTGGYNCTQTRFVKVIGFNKTGKKAFVQKMGQRQVDGDWMNGNITAGETDVTKTYQFMVKKCKYADRELLRGTIYDGCRNENYLLWDGKPIWNNCD